MIFCTYTHYSSAANQTTPARKKHSPRKRRSNLNGLSPIYGEGARTLPVLPLKAENGSSCRFGQFLFYAHALPRLAKLRLPSLSVYFSSGLWFYESSRNFQDIFSGFFLFICSTCIVMFYFSPRVLFFLPVFSMFFLFLFFLFIFSKFANIFIFG